jgi:hypothetical protein
MTILRPYLIPVVTIVLTLAIGFGVGAWAPRFRTPKTTRHFCNAYALGVAEREHLPRYASWSNCRPILARDFGRTDVGPLRAAVASPRALFRHFTWNLRLLSRSIELMLWGATGAAEGSDYYPVPAGSRAARVATIVLAVAVAAAYRHAPAPLDPEAATRRHWGFAGVGGLLAPSLVVLFASRARAPYLAPVGLAAFLLVGLAIERLWRGARSRGAELAAIAVVAAALPFVPPRYDAQYATPMSGPGQPIMTAVRRLSAHRAELASPSVRLASAVRPMALCAYLSTAAGWCEEVSAKWMRAVDDPAAFDAALRAIGTTHAYLDETLPRQAAEALERADLGWTRVGPPGRDEPWVLLRAGVRPAR